jgi:hypothetical protein
MSEKLAQEVQAIVDNIFKQQEELAMRQETEEALTKSAEKINELVASLEAKDNEISELVSKAGELEGTIAELSDKISELETEKDNFEKEKSDFEAKEKELTERASKAEEEIENIRKDQLASARFDTLKEEGVAATTEETIKDQITKIREMEDEEFEAYKAERVELRKSVVAELEASSDSGETVSSSDSEEEAASEEETGSEEETASEEDGETTAELEDEEAAADSEDSINPMKAIAASLNMEQVVTDDVSSKYRKLGEALAEKYKSKSK